MPLLSWIQLLFWRNSGRNFWRIAVICKNSHLIKEKHQIGTAEIVSYVFSFSGRKFLTRIPTGILLEKAAKFSYCLSFRPREGLKLLSDTESQWQPRASLVTHVWWHKALFHFQLGTIYIYSDSKISAIDSVQDFLSSWTWNHVCI